MTSLSPDQMLEISSSSVMAPTRYHPTVSETNALAVLVRDLVAKGKRHNPFPGLMFTSLPGEVSIRDAKTKELYFSTTDPRADPRNVPNLPDLVARAREYRIQPQAELGKLAAQMAIPFYSPNAV